MQAFKRIVMVLILTICSTLLLVSLAFVYVIVSPKGGKFLVDLLVKQYSSAAVINIGHYEGSIQKGFVLKDVRLSGLEYIPDAVVLIQETRIQVPLLNLKHTDFDILNARVLISSCDPIVFNGHITEGQIKGNLYAHLVDIHAVSRFWTVEDIRKNLQGFVSDLDAMIEGPLFQPRIIGRFYVDRIRYKTTLVSEGSARVDLTLLPSTGEFHMKGECFLDAGEVTTRQVSLELTQSKVSFSGDATNPSLDIHGGSKIEDVDISLSIQGTLKLPVLKVVSDPPLPQETALLMLATGKSWSASTTALGKDGFTGALAGDFMDYFLLGGGGGEFAKKYGITDVSMQYDNQSKRIGVKKKLTDDLKIGVELEQMPTVSGAAASYSKKLEGEMLMTEHLSVNVSKKVLPVDKSLPKTSQEIQQDGETQIYLKYKERF